MLKIWKKMMVLLDGKQKAYMVLLVFMMLIGAILEAVSVAIIVPVITVVVTPDQIHKNAMVSALYNILPVEDDKSFGIAVMILLILAFVLKNIYIYVMQKVLYHFVYTNQFSTSERMMRNYMLRGYEFFLNADTAVIQRSITSDVNNMYGLILAMLQLISECIVFVVLAAVLVITEPWMTIITASLLGITLLAIKAVLKPIMRKAGEDNQDYYSNLFKWINQTITGIKEVKIGCREKYFITTYSEFGRGYVNAVQRYTLYNNMPRLIIETVCVAGMVSYFLYLFVSGQEMDNFLSTLAAFGVALARLMPSANRINNYLNNISFFEPFFMGVSDNLQEEIDGKNTDITSLEPASEKLPFAKEIQLCNVSYKYPNTDKWILKDLNMSIPAGSAIGIVGETGSGKSTLVDVMLGLLAMHEGQIKVDGKDIFEADHYKKWLKNIGYIPQTVFMIDDSIRKNVAFGIPEDEIDDERVWEALREAQLERFVKELPEGLDTGIGERGIRLSGGQRQRISIARALYEDPSVLVLDEATAALDNGTEKAIMDSINHLHGKKTLIIIAHRLQTIEKCDAVYRIEGTKAVRER